MADELKPKGVTLTVGELRKLLEGVPDDTHVIIGAPYPLPEGWGEWLNADGVMLPDGNGIEGFTLTTALTIKAADTFDPRQF